MLGVASIALRAAGCASPEVSADPISRWDFDETDPEEEFLDLGPANLPMTLGGAWVDLTTGSIVQDDDGTSAYTNGSGYATILANQSAHNLGALTISFYYQRHSAAAKQILFAAGDGAQAGDFSIEVLANGTLRGYHVGQDGVLRFFDGPGGIAGTNLQVGTAHRIDLTLGQQGARIYLDGAELTGAAIPANVNGWNNARVKYLGRWTDGVLAPAVGAFDRFRLWDRQLANAEIALLQPAQSINLSEDSQPAQELSVPSLAEWLVSDEPDPPVTKYVSDGNRGNGSGSSAANAREVQAALNGASPGDTFLAVCQTPGTTEFWHYPNGLTFPNGTPGNPITLQARNGDAIVICDNNFAAFRKPGSGAWTQSGLSQSDIEKKIWRSVATFDGGAAMIGYWVEFDHVHQLLSYGNMNNLRAPHGTANSFTNYAGPGAHLHTDRRVYIRMQKPHPGKYSFGNTWQDHLWPNNPEAISNGRLNYPISENPNDYDIRLVRRQATTAFKTTSGIAGGFIKIGSGINSYGYERVLFGHDITMRRGTHLVWRNLINAGSSSNLHENYDIQRCRFSDGSKRHVARAEWKFGGPLEGLRSAFIQMSGATYTTKNLSFKDCTIADFHEIVVGQPNEYRLRNCAIFNIVDDGIQGKSGGTRTEIAYSFFLDAAIGGNDRGGSGDVADPNPGEWYVHHNILDFRSQRCYSWRAQAAPGWLWLNHSADKPQPRKNYNNTILWGPDTEEAQTAGMSHNGNRDNTLSGNAVSHEVFNNIFIRQDRGQRYDPNTGYSALNKSRTDSADSRISCDPNQANGFWDYNLYYRDLPQIPGGGFADGLIAQVRKARNDTERDYHSISDFINNVDGAGLFNLSKTGGSKRGAYPPGFLANSTDTRPTLPCLNLPADRFKYRPSATSAVTVASTTSLSGSNWWSTPPSWGGHFPWSGLAPSNWKGALDPNGSTMPVGVQNP